MIGTLGSMVFQTSSEKVLTFRDLSRGGSPRYEEHEVINNKPVLEFVAPGLDTFSFNIRLDILHGVIPDKEIDKMRQAMEGGQILPFVVGGKYLGDWVITSMTENMRYFDNKGGLLVAEVSISLKEVRS